MSLTMMSSAMNWRCGFYIVTGYLPDLYQTGKLNQSNERDTAILYLSNLCIAMNP